MAPATSSPGPTSTGVLSPVSSDRSTAELPSTTTPSVAIRSPGRTTNVVPTASSSIGTWRSMPVVAEHARLLRPELEEGAQSGAGAALRARLEISPGENEGRHNRCNLEVERAHPGVAVGHELEAHRLSRLARAEEEQGDHGPAPGGERADRDQRVHRGRSVPQARPRLPVERPTAPEDDRGREHEARPLPGLEPERRNHGEERVPGARERPRPAGDAAAVAAESSTSGGAIAPAGGTEARYPAAATAATRSSVATRTGSNSTDARSVA